MRILTRGGGGGGRRRSDFFWPEWKDELGGQGVMVVIAERGEGAVAQRWKQQDLFSSRSPLAGGQGVE